MVRMLSEIIKTTLLGLAYWGAKNLIPIILVVSIVIKMGYIYKITNTITNKCYIGETKEADPEKRWRAHKYTISKGRGCPALQDAVRKHGVENFKFEVLIICFDEDRFEYEKQYIKKYNSMVPNGYNILEGGLGGGGFKGKKHTPETLARISELNRGKKITEETKKRISDIVKKMDISNRLKSSEKWQKAVKEGRVGGHNAIHSESVKEKISKSLKEYYKIASKNGENPMKSETAIIKHRESMAKAVGKAVSQYDQHGICIASFKSIAEAGRSTGIHKNSILNVLKGRSSIAGGCIWKYNS